MEHLDHQSVRVMSLRVGLILAAALSCAALGVQFQRTVGIGRAAATLGLSHRSSSTTAHIQGDHLPEPLHWEIRKAILKLEKTSIPDGSVMLLGDSIIESFYPNHLVVGNQICAVANAGCASIGVRDLLDLTQTVVDTINPSFVMLAIGINDARPDIDLASWVADYNRLVDVLTSNGIATALFTMIPPEAGLPLSGYFPLDIVERLNREIREIGATRGLPVIDTASAVADSHGMARAGTTVDGVHPHASTVALFERKWLPDAVMQLQRNRKSMCASASSSFVTGTIEDHRTPLIPQLEVNSR